MSRNVTIREKDGTLNTITDVPDNYTDEQVAKRYNGELVTPPGDILKSAGSGAVSGLTQLGLLGPKIVTGAFGGLANAAGSEELKLAPRRSLALIRAIEKKADELGAGYTPKSESGRRAKAIAGGAVTIPFTRDVKTLLTEIGLGGLSGLAGKEVSERYGDTAGVMASMAPFAASAGLRALWPSFAAKNTVHALNTLTPAQREEIAKYLAVSRQPDVGLNAMPWQVAGPNTSLGHLGERAALQPEAGRIQMRLQEQLPLANQATIKQATAPDFAAANPVPVSPEQALALKQGVAAVGKERFLPPEDVLGKAVDQQANRFGNFVEQKVPQEAILSEMLSLRKKAISLPPGSPDAADLLKRAQELQAILGGNAPWPTTQVFQPRVSNLGQVEAIRQDIGAPRSEFATPSEGAKHAMQEAVQKKAAEISPVYAQALRKYGDTAETVKRVRETAEKTAGKNIENLSGEARIALGPTALYAGAVNPLWAGVPITRDLARKIGANQLDRYMSLNSVEEMTKMATKEAQARWLIEAMRSLGMPVQLGATDPASAGER